MKAFLHWIFKEMGPWTETGIEIPAKSCYMMKQEIRVCACGYFATRFQDKWSEKEDL